MIPKMSLGRKKEESKTYVDHQKIQKSNNLMEELLKDLDDDVGQKSE